MKIAESKFKKLKVIHNNILVEVNADMEKIYLDNDRCLYLILDSSKDSVDTHVRIVKIGNKVKGLKIGMWVWVNHYQLRCALGTIEHPDPRSIQCGDKKYAIIDADYVYGIEKEKNITPVNGRCFVTPISEEIKTSLVVPENIKNLKVKMTCRVLSLGKMSDEETQMGYGGINIGDIVVIRPNSYIEIDPTLYKKATKGKLSDIEIETTEDLWSVPYYEVSAIVPSNSICRIAKPKNIIPV